MQFTGPCLTVTREFCSFRSSDICLVKIKELLVYQFFIQSKGELTWCCNSGFVFKILREVIGKSFNSLTIEMYSGSQLLYNRRRANCPSDMCQMGLPENNENRLEVTFYDQYYSVPLTLLWNFSIQRFSGLIGEVFHFAVLLIL